MVHAVWYLLCPRHCSKMHTNPYCRPIVKVGTILIHIFENYIYLESSRSRIGAQEDALKVMLLATWMIYCP